MTDDIEIQEDELTVLKNRADQLGLKYHPSIGVEALKAKIAEALVEPEPEKPAEPVELTAGEKRAKAKRDANRLVRCRITCMNPNKREWEGEIFTTGNAVVGTVKKMVPFDTEFHVPQILLNMIKERQCQVFNTIKVNGNATRKGKLIKEFAVEILDPLSAEEIKDIAQRQAMAAGNAA